jgi:predicted membrane channel-forming protein YqfA (hemolysin III family)
MMNQTEVQTLQQRARQLGKAVIVLVVIVAAQVVALEVVLRGWQGKDAMVVYIAIGASALFCAIAVIIFLWTWKRGPRLVDSQRPV